MRGLRKSFFVLMITSLAMILCACQPQTGVGPPTITPFPTWTPTPTPAPSKMEIFDVLEKCEQLSDDNREIILEGSIFLPDEFINGYTIDGETWLALNLTNSDNISILVKVGTGVGTMNELPTLFSEKDLIIRANDGSLIYDRYRIRVNAITKYRRDKNENQCEVFANSIQTLESPQVNIPKELTVDELFDDDTIDDCQMIEYANQLVLLKGRISVNNEDTVCWSGRCRTPFSDSTGQMMVQLSDNGGNNSIVGLVEPYSMVNLKLIDQDGFPADPTDVRLIGILSAGVETNGPVTVTNSCLLTVYTVLASGAD